MLTLRLMHCGGRELRLTAPSQRSNRMVRLARRTALAAMAMTAAVCAAAGAASPTPSSAGGKLVLVGDQAGLYVMNTDGSGLRQLTHSGWDVQPHWSPDGRWIAFLHDDLDETRVVIMRGDGSGRRVLGSAGVGGIEAPDPWSPDGKRIAWSGCGGLCVFDLRSSRRTEISLGSGDEDDDASSFSWSPDGRKLVAVDLYESRRLVIVDAAGGILEMLPAAGDDPAWSPDGREIAFNTDETNKLELVRPGGGVPRIVASNVGSAATWSPDGHRLLYTGFTRQPPDSSVRVLNVVTHTNTRVDGSHGIARWSPDGSMIAYGRRPIPFVSGEDVWIAAAAGDSRRQLTGEFPTGLSFSDLDWASGSVAAGPPPPPPDLLQLTATAELTLDDDVTSFARAATPDSVVYRTDDVCDPDAETTTTYFNIWTPATGQTVTSSSYCEDWGPDSYGVTSSLVASASQVDLNGTETLTVTRTGATETPVVATWTSGQESPDIGWRAGLGDVVSDGSMILFATSNDDNKSWLWRIADGEVAHAIAIPTPPGATSVVDADAGRIIVRTGKTSLAVLSSGGAVLTRIPVPARATVRLSGSLLGVAFGSTLSVYDADNGALDYRLPLSHTSGVPRLLTIGAGYAVYASGIELHLLRLDNGSDRIVDLPGQSDSPQALLTTEGLYIAYDRGYDPQPGRILFVPAANLP
jgi:dipeptidyl aminopeptidase/acylaminoacyl peptidase